MVFPYYKQETKYSCGAAAMRMIFEHFGIKMTEKEVAMLLHCQKDEGVWNEAFPDVAEMYKFNFVVGRHAEIKTLRSLTKQGYKIIVGYFSVIDKNGHYSVVRKIDSNYIYFWDPDPTYGPRHKYTLRYFKQVWRSDPRYDKEKAWFIALRKPLWPKG